MEILKPIIENRYNQIPFAFRHQIHPHHHSPSFPSRRSYAFPSPQFQISDLEMITLQTVSYTSLKDLLPTSPPAILSPTSNSSWHEIPIKNPLVKQAALSYLQPMSSLPEVESAGIFGIFKQKFCGGSRGGQCGCIRWFGDFVSKTVREVFSVRGRRNESDEEEEDKRDYGGDDDEKVDWPRVILEFQVWPVDKLSRILYIILFFSHFKGFFNIILYIICKWLKQYKPFFFFWVENITKDFYLVFDIIVTLEL